MNGVVIVGAGHSGGKAAHALRKQGWSGPITLIGNESQPPYDRPPLSKAVLLGKKTADACEFWPAQWYAEQSIELVLARSVTAIARSQKTVALDDGRTIPYDQLLLATGARPIALPVPGANLPGVSQLRTTRNASLVASYLTSDSRIVVIGAGFIGLEVAAAARELGCHVTVLEAAPHALTRSLPEIVSDELIGMHRERGVDLRFGVSVAAIEGTDRATAVRLSTGESIPCDHVVYGIGVRPDTHLAEAAGLDVDNGVVVGPDLRTSDPAIFACGDVCTFTSTRYGRPLRLESWKNAEDQADLVARSMLGQEVAYDPLPWFWSNQYDAVLQIAGLPALGSVIAQRKIGSGRLFFSLASDGTLIGVSAFGPVRDVALSMRVVKEWVLSATPLSPALLADADIKLDHVAAFAAPSLA